jgi:outer membrane protein assembly factor BamE (lipoprotein component of BamABCDE complex)
MWAPLLAGALAVVASQRSVLKRWAHDLLDDSTHGSKRSEQFARSVVGKSRNAIVRMIGSPAATARNSHGQDQWYYPINKQERLAIAITFSGDHVESATLLRGISPAVASESKAII